ncbi:MAG: YigZ family protein [Kouleothrix sp.]|jgi:uncharacterized YigZ family protein|nr:YigZ family protein [Kouleothrix sp.]
MTERDKPGLPGNYIPAEPARAEICVVNSRFIASIAPATDVAAARAFIAAVRAAMPDATHHVYAYIIGHGASTTLGMSDDGEPPGTAGRPTMAVLRGSGLGDVAIVVTRYFGGTLLGTGGLVRAYGDAARAVLAIVPRSEKIARGVLELTLPYSAYEPVRRLVAAHAGSILGEAFAEDVLLRVELPLAELAAFRSQIEQITAGQARFGVG